MIPKPAEAGGFMAEDEKATSWGHVVFASCKAVRHTHTHKRTR